MTTLEKAQAAVGALRERLTVQVATLEKTEAKLASLQVQWGELAEGDNNKAISTNERAQTKCEAEIKRAARRIEGLEKRLVKARADLPLAQFEADSAELDRLEAESKQLYGLYRKRATELVALAGELDRLERQAGTVGMRARANANGRPCPKPNMRRGFETGGGTWHHQYGPDQGLVRFLAWVRKCERVLGWAAD